MVDEVGPPKGPETISKSASWGLVFLATIPLLVVEALGRAFGFRDQGRYTGVSRVFDKMFIY